MNKKIWITIAVVSFITLLVAGTSFALLVQVRTSENTAKLSTQNVMASLDFKLDSDVKGVPGESLPISEKNTITKTSSSEPVAFKVVYEIAKDSGVDFISNLELKNSTVTSLVRDKNSTPTKLTYYGVLNSDNIQSINLGDIYAEFKKVNNESASKSYNIIAEFTACQRNGKAITDILGVSPVGEYSFLVN